MSISYTWDSFNHYRAIESVQRFADQRNVSIVRQNIGAVSTEQETTDRDAGLQVAVQNSPEGLAPTVFNETDMSNEVLEAEAVSAFVILQKSFFEALRNTSNNQTDKQRLIIIAYEQNSTLFMNNETNSTGSVVLTILRSPEQGPPPMNLIEPVQIFFKVNTVRK